MLHDYVCVLSINPYHPRSMSKSLGDSGIVLDDLSKGFEIPFGGARAVSCRFVGENYSRSTVASGSSPALRAINPMDGIFRFNLINERQRATGASLGFRRLDCVRLARRVSAVCFWASVCLAVPRGRLSCALSLSPDSIYTRTTAFRVDAQRCDFEVDNNPATEPRSSCIVLPIIAITLFPIRN